MTIANNVSRRQQDLVQQFAENGLYEFPHPLDPVKTRALAQIVRDSRTLDGSLFLTKDEWDKSPKTHRGTNPNTGRNILEKHPGMVDFVLKDPEIKNSLETLLGKNFRLLYQKIVCRIPYTTMPQWVQKGLEGFCTTTLGAYIHPEYRDISYLYDHDIHQDVLEWVRMEQREHRMVTLIVDLEETPCEDAPVCLFPGSHKLGVTHFPHELTRNNKGSWHYGDGQEHGMDVNMLEVAGGLGYTAMFHACMLHGARPLLTGKPRLVLRLIFLRSTDPEPCGIDMATTPDHNPENMKTPFASGPREQPDGFVRMEKSDFLR